jgi:hypothetical protein
MSKYIAARREIADRYIPAQLSILSDYFHCAIEDIRLGTVTEDMQQSTDAVLPTGETIGLRVRTPEMIKYKADFVVRDQPNSPYPTEFAKLLNGKPDYLLYTIALNSTDVEFFSLIDCEAIRAAERSGWRCTVPPNYI